MKVEKTTSNQNGKVRKGTTCKMCRQSVEFGKMKEHWEEAHRDTPLPYHLRYGNKYSKRRTEAIKTSLKPSNDVPLSVPKQTRIFSYFCPGCGSPIATALNEDVCKVCRLPQGPILMGMNLAVQHMV